MKPPEITTELVQIGMQIQAHEPLSPHQYQQLQTYRAACAVYREWQATAASRCPHRIPRIPVRVVQ